MYIMRVGKMFAVLDRKKSEICRFDRLADACIVQRFLSNQTLPELEEKHALRLIKKFDEVGDGE